MTDSLADFGIGPKAYFATEDLFGRGSTALHIDMTDAVNRLSLSLPGSRGSSGARWIMVALEDTLKLARLLTDLGMANGLNPIMDQRVFIDDHLAAKIRQAGIRLYEFTQKPGDAVFIPAGVPHQVCNIATFYQASLIAV